MSIVDRRRFLFAASAGGVWLGRPAWAQMTARGFTHDVASGEPGPGRVLLWTRYVAASGATRLSAEISESEDFARIVGGGTTEAREDNDYTAKLVVDGLAPGRWYHYRFVAPDGTYSPTGRTRTLPVGETPRFAIGVFSCSNLPFGFFNAYGHAAARDDLDLMVHLGDYIYEYKRDGYPTAAEAVAGRRVEPAGEAIHLADYRARYGSYRLDPNLRALHRRFPMIAMWDDHESANDSYRDGAENHDPATEGDWATRKRAAVKAYREWMPVSDSDWAEYRIGDLASLFRPEERLGSRTRQVDLAAAVAQGGDLAAALAAFRDGPWRDPAHTLFGAPQEAWFAGAMRAAAGATRWQVLAQQVNVGFTRMPAEAANWVPPGADVARRRIAAAIAAARAGLPFNMDSWNGYPAARSRMLRNGLDADANLIVLSGDSHNAWAFDLKEGGIAAGVEFGGHSVTSPGFEHYLTGVDAAAVARALIGASDELRWADTSQRGYMTVALTPDQARAEWLFLDTIRRPSLAIATRHQAAVQRGARRLSA